MLEAMYGSKSRPFKGVGKVCKTLNWRNSSLEVFIRRSCTRQSYSLASFPSENNPVKKQTRDKQHSTGLPTHSTAIQRRCRITGKKGMDNGTIKAAFHQCINLTAHWIISIEEAGPLSLIFIMLQCDFFQSSEPEHEKRAELQDSQIGYKTPTETIT